MIRSARSGRTRNAVLGFLFNPIFPITKWSCPKVPGTSNCAQFQRPNDNTFCTVADNECDPGYIAGDVSFCKRTDRKCWWHRSVTFSTTPADYPGSTAVSSEPPWTQVHQPNCVRDDGGVEIDPPANAVIVDNIPNKATVRTGCNNSNWVSQGSFDVTYGKDGAGVPIGQIDWHQLGVGWGGHVWFTKNRKDWNDQAHINKGTWRPPDLSGVQQIQVHIPSNGASSERASYKIYTSANDNDPYTVIINQHIHANKWVTLGNVTLQAGARVELTNLTGEETYAHNVAFDAVAFTPTTGAPLPTYQKFIDRSLGLNPVYSVDAGDPVNPSSGNFHDTAVDRLFPSTVASGVSTSSARSTRGPSSPVMWATAGPTASASACGRSARIAWSCSTATARSWRSPGRVRPGRGRPASGGISTPRQPIRSCGSRPVRSGRSPTGACAPGRTARARR